MKEKRYRNGKKRQWIDAEDTADIEVEGMRFSLKRPHEYKRRVDEEQKYTNDSYPLNLPIANPFNFISQQDVLNENREHSYGAEEVEVWQGAHCK
jgi:hypothetical protein